MEMNVLTEKVIGAAMPTAENSAISANSAVNKDLYEFELF
jgi:hypothetical protein